MHTAHTRFLAHVNVKLNLSIVSHCLRGAFRKLLCVLCERGQRIFAWLLLFLNKAGSTCGQPSAESVNKIWWRLEESDTVPKTQLDVIWTDAHTYFPDCNTHVSVVA